MRTGSIYIIKNNINNNVYIGQTTMTVKERFMTHMKPCTAKKRSSYKLYNAINKYGKENFYFEILEENIPIEKIDEKEIFYINKYDSYKNGYNSTPGGDGRIINKLNNEEEVLEMAKKGMSTSEIAKLLNVHSETIIRTLHKLGFYYIKEIEKDKLLKMVKENKTNEEIANYFNVDKKTIYRHLKKYNISRRRANLILRTDINIEDFCNDYINGIEPKILESKYNISKTSIYKLAKKYNLSEKRLQIKKQKLEELNKSIYEDYKNGINMKDLVKKYKTTDKIIYYRINEFKKTI